MFRIVAFAATLPLLFTTALATAQVLERRQIARQSEFYEGQHPAVRGDLISLNGSFVFAAKEDTMDEFLAAGADEIAAWLRLHLDRGGHLEHVADSLIAGNHPTFYVFLDIEYKLHPKHLWKYWDPAHHPEPKYSKQEVADAFNMRLRITKQVLNEMFPQQDVKVGLFSTLESAPGGFPYATDYMKRLENLTELASMGMLDEADFCVPVLFPRYASTDARYYKVERTIMQGLDGSAQLRRSDGSSLPMMPLLALRIYNGSQPPGLVRVSWLREAIEVIRNSGHEIEALAFWVALTEDAECIGAYFDQLFPPEDWNFDCVSDTFDDMLVSDAISKHDFMADFNRDGQLDTTDWDLYHGKKGALPPAGPCSPEVDCPSQPDLFDFLEFQRLFTLGDRDADLNRDGVVDFFDFMAFQEEAANPCP